MTEYQRPGNHSEMWSVRVRNRARNKIAIVGGAVAVIAAVSAGQASAFSLYFPGVVDGIRWGDYTGPDGSASKTPDPVTKFTTPDCRTYLWGGPNADQHMHCYTVWTMVDVHDPFGADPSKLDAISMLMDENKYSEEKAADKVAMNYKDSAPVFRGSGSGDCYPQTNQGDIKWTCAVWDVFSYTSS
ncbi:hypothetical protein [Streptomyces sp. NPDC047028]|uniref:hypothetical protein n=1 Tax=Streptomyces sp. NPDC047028 TaxID=3155793 RepID=UPI0033FAE488